MLPFNVNKNPLLLKNADVFVNASHGFSLKETGYILSDFSSDNTFLTMQIIQNSKFTVY